MTPQRVLTALAVLAVAAGLALNALSLAAAGNLSRRLGDKARALTTLRGMADGAARLRAHRTAFEQFGDAAPPDLRGLVESSGLAPGAEVRGHDSRPVLPGWILESADITLGEADLPRVEALLRQAEAARPPWRASAVTIHATSRDGGKGQATLSVECLRRDPGAD
jgi:hypothetical protein